MLLANFPFHCTVFSEEHSKFFCIGIHHTWWTLAAFHALPSFALGTITSYEYTHLICRQTPGGKHVTARYTKNKNKKHIE